MEKQFRPKQTVGSLNLSRGTIDFPKSPCKYCDVADFAIRCTQKVAMEPNLSRQIIPVISTLRPPIFFPERTAALVWANAVEKL